MKCLCTSEHSMRYKRGLGALCAVAGLGSHWDHGDMVGQLTRLGAVMAEYRLFRKDRRGGREGRLPVM